MAGITIIVLHKIWRCDEPEDNFEVFVLGRDAHGGAWGEDMVVFDSI
jgi:hypothetical protein